MEGLDLLKQEWKRQDASLPKYKKTDFYPMLLKRSSSIVKWIFYVSVIEFVFWITLSLITAIFDKNNLMTQEAFKMFNWVDNIIFYGVIIYFMVIFYRNYKRINSTNSVKELMDNILKTRRTVKHYVWFNLAFFAISLICAVIILFNTESFKLTEGRSLTSFVFRVFLVLTVALALLVGIYRLLYGTLTRRLKRNFEELQKIEI